MEAIILAGGLGTRLRSEIKDIPKPMALINSRPFMEYLLDQLIEQGVTKIIFSVGHKSEFIQDHFSDKYKDREIVYAIEETLLGTGGAIKNAMQSVTGQNVIIVNGDSIFITDIQSQLKAHINADADVTLALKPMQDIERYGTVDTDQKGRIIRFNEKKPIKEGLVNTGTYIFNVDTFQALEFPLKFSIEKDFFETHLEQMYFSAHPSDGYFLDIGIPEDFKKAQYEIGIFPKIDNSWTLFLDRDGVINKKRDNDYVKNTDELELLPGAVQAIANLSKIFGRVIIATNQQGIGKGLMSAEDLSLIHELILKEVENAGGHIDAIYYAPQLKSENSDMRKPNTGMALQAQKDFKEIDFSKSVMVGDSLCDLEFGKRAKMIPVIVKADNDDTQYDYTVTSLFDFSEIIKNIFDSYHYS